MDRLDPLVPRQRESGPRRPPPDRPGGPAVMGGWRRRAVRPVVPAAQGAARGRDPEDAAGAGDDRRAFPVHARSDDPDPEDPGPAARVVGAAEPARPSPAST